MHDSYFTLLLNKMSLWRHLARMVFYFYESILQILIPALVTILTVLVMSQKIRAEETSYAVTLDSLGDLQLQFSTVSNAEFYKDSPLTAKVSYAQSDEFIIIAPFQPQQTTMLLPHGTSVKKGQTIARISGSEVHHFQEMLASQKFVFEVMQKRFNEGKLLFGKGAISIHKWAEIAEQYHNSRIEYGHLKHFAELVKTAPDSQDTALLLSPENGVLLYPDMISTPTTEPVLAAVIPHNRIKLEIAAPVKLASSIAKVATPYCESGFLNIAGQENAADNFHISLWSEPVQDCQLHLGQNLRVTPLIAKATQVLPKSSVFSWEKSPHVLVKQGLKLIPTPVTIIASVTNAQEQQSYFIEPNLKLTNGQVLNSSVAAVQGMLAGMGGE